MAHSKIDKKQVQDILGLTAMQEGMLFHYLANPGSQQYFEQILLRLSGKIDFQVMEKAWHYVANDNEMLRSVIRWEKLESPVQIILKEKDIPIRFFDLTEEEGDSQSKLLDKIIHDDREQPIDLSETPMRITLCRLRGDECEMIITFHHIIYDGWSNAIILGEFQEAYDRLLEGEAPVPHSKTRYKEFFKWYRLQDKQDLNEFWKDYLGGFDTRTMLPYDKNKTETIQALTSHKLEVPREFKERMETFARENNQTLSTLLYAAWGILLQKYNNSDDVIFGTTVSGRIPQVKGIDNVVGLFINTLPVRLRSTGEYSVKELLDSVGGHLKERGEFEHSSLTDIKQYTGIGKENDLFDSIIVVDNYPMDRVSSQSDNLRVHSCELFEMTNFDLTLQVLPFDHMEICFHYNRELFHENTLQRMASHYVNILRGMVKDAAQPVSSLEMLDEAEAQKILTEFNQPSIRYMVDDTIHGIIEQQAEKYPANAAVRYEENEIDYREFNRRANRLAHMLREQGAVNGTRVALMFHRSIDMIVGVTGILKAGAACIPLDITYPDERNNFIIQDSGAAFLLKSHDIQYKHGSGAKEIVYDAAQLENYPDTNPEVGVKPDDLAYIIYTSGSTGKPKGALLVHSGIVNHTRTKIKVLGITNEDTVGNNFSVNVIASVWQILSPLFEGARLIVYSDEIEWDPYLQFQKIEDDNVTVIEVIPPVLKTYLYLVEEGNDRIPLAKLRKIALTSEETKPILVNKFHTLYPTGIDLVDCYGQTECSDDILHYTIPHDTDTQVVPIGTPSINTRVIVLNHHNQLQPIGVVGEICASGAGVGSGYWNRPELSDEKFVDNPIEPGVRMYRTGDLGRWRPDGIVEFLGRIDHQVKIRGNRVELREIENHILAHPDIEEAAVIAKEDRDNELNLFGFFVSGREITISELRRYLLSDLPDYMIPIHFVQLEKLPLTPNGKINRKELAKVEGTISTGNVYHPPRNDYEKKIQQIWNQLLDRESIGVDDHFFDLGGHSLLLIKLKNKLEKAFNKEISIIELFNYPTISHQARFFSGEQDREEAHREAHAGMKPFKARKESGGIAVIGISLKIPGAEGIDEFWHNIANGVESISFFEKEELEGSQVEEFVQGNLKLVPAGGFIGDIDMFDADFFGFNPREAEIVEPQQRLFLEHSWRAMEDAGYVGEYYPGEVGVFAGVGLNTYLLNNVMSHPQVVNSLGEFQTMIGNDKDFLSTRVSYKLNLRGPSFTIQCACSSSLVAVHLAKQSLLNDECGMALAGGVMIHVPEKTGYFYNEGGYLSPDGHCRAFDANADGTVFSNGIGVVVLKRLEDALADNDHIYAVIKGSGINNDGSLKVGFTSPSEIGQSNAIYRAVSEAGFDPETIGYIETHGTGTVLGDPVEIAALTRAYRALGSSGKKQYCALGSVKSSIGHMDIAAGVVGLIKAVLCLKNKQVPPSINVENPNPMLDLPNTPFYVSTQLSDWETGDNPRRAGVSSFGIGGTNAHMVLEEAPAYEPAEQTRPWQIINLSARTETALESTSQNLLAFLKENPKINLADVAFTQKVGRKAFDKNIALVVKDRDDAVDVLEKFDKKRILKHTRKEGEKSVVFMFPGIGDHYVNMSRELYDIEPVFRQEVDSCCNILEPLLERDLRQVIFSDKINRFQDKPGDKEGQKIDLRKLVNREEQPLSDEEKELSRTIYSQTSVFVIEYALARLLMSWGIKPYAMIGYSLGEYVAACISGVFSLQDALFLVASRAKLIHQVEQGAMLAVNMTEDELKPLLPGGVSLAAKNTPDLCILSGKLAAVDELENQLKEKKAIYRRLKTFQAFHSKMMEAVRPQLAKVVKKVTASAPSIPYLSNVTGTWVSAEEVTKPEYWINHTVNPIRFSEGITQLLETSCNYFLEIGPGNSLSGFTAQHPKNPEVTDRFVLASMPKESEKVSDVSFLLRTLSRLFMAGVHLDWNKFYKHEKRRRISIPTYPFERKRYWLDPMPPELNGEISLPGIQAPGIIRKKENIDDWFYVPAWKQTAPTFGDPIHEIGEADSAHWLLLIDESTLGTRVMEQLKLAGQSVSIVKPGGEYAKYGSDEYTVNPAQPDDYVSMFEDLQEQGKSIDKIIHLWQLDAGDDFLDRGVYSLLYLVKAMGQLFMFNPVDLWLVSRQLHKIQSSDNCLPEQAAILGPINVISQEYPNISCRTVDIEDPTAPSHDEAFVVQNLLNEFTGAPAERIIAYRGDSRWIQEYQPVTPPKNQSSLPLRENGVYLVTGGLGNIGLSIAHFLAETVQARVVLTTRSDFPEESQWPQLSRDENSNLRDRARRLLEIKEAGGDVMVVRADAADREQVASVVKQAQERFGPLNGVLHAAGVMNEEAFKLISDLEKEQCEMHFDPKIKGLYVLEDILKDIHLDFCVLTSSLSPILGGLSLYAYSAANSFMDAFAQRQAQVFKKNWLSLNWADWHRDDAPVDPAAQTVVGATVMALNITPQEGKETFKKALSMNRAHRIVVSSGDLPARLRQWVLKSGDGEDDTGSQDSRAAVHKRPDLQSIYEPPKNESEKIVAEIWQDLLGLDMVGVYDNFFELGGHSLIATKLISRLREIFRIDIPLPTLFDRPTVRELVESIVHTWGDNETVEEIAKTYREVMS